LDKIRQAKTTDLAAVKRMTDTYIGKDFYTMSQLEEFHAAPDKFLFVYVNEADEAVAFFYIFMSSLKEALRVLHAPADCRVYSELSPDSRVGVFKTACTERAYRNRGLFTTFFYAMEEVFLRNRIRHTLIPALRDPNGVIPVENVVLEDGFQPTAVFAHPWSHIDAYCPYCRQANCQCDCVIFTKEMG
jgi:hypothetical protein